MTVGELVDKLKEFDQAMEVQVGDERTGYGPVGSVQVGTVCDYEEEKRTNWKWSDGTPMPTKSAVTLS